jgi:TonB-dependent receptor-like protein
MLLALLVGLAPSLVPMVASAQEEPADPYDETKPPDPLLVDVEGGHADETAPTEQHLAQREVARMPGAFGDAFRAIEALPGVTPIASGLPHLFVRGATPSASGYFVDGIKVPFLYHLGVGPSVINPAILDDVAFYPGAYPAAYGRHVGGIVTASTRAPSGEFHAEALVRLFDSGAYVEVPLFDQQLTVFGAARYSYTSLLLGLIAPDTKLEYWDYQGGFWLRLSPRERVGVFAFGSRDHLGQIEDEVENEVFGAEFHRVQARLELLPQAPGSTAPPGASARLAFTFGFDRSGLGDKAELGSRTYGLRSDVTVPVVSWLTLRGGIDLVADDIEFTQLEEPPPEDEDLNGVSFDIADAFGTRTTGTGGAYIDAVIQPVPMLQIIPGFRADIFAEPGTTKVGLDPRGSVRLEPIDWLAIHAAAGLMHQKPTLLINVPGLDPVGLSRGLQEALQISHGIELGPPDEVEVGLTTFWHDYRDLTDYSATCGNGIDECSPTDRADGRSYGLEVSVRRPLSKEIGGLVSYTLSRSERTFRGDTFVGDFDRTHVINVVINADLGHRWYAGARFMGYTGRPYSLIAVDDPEDPFDTTLIGRRNALRRRGFFRVDVRLEKRWVILERGWISLVLEGFNVSFQKETIDFDCRLAEILGSQAGLSCGGQQIGPISIPSLGVAGGL